MALAHTFTSRRMNPLLYSLFIGINDLGYVPIHPKARPTAFRIAVQPHEKWSFLITTHLNVEEWVHLFGHPQMIQTLIVRFTYPCLVLETAKHRGRLKN